jgi:hypothetical protein
MQSFKFSAEIQIQGINPYVLVRKDQAEQIKKDWHKPMPVCIRVNEKPEKAWHINMMPVGNGSFYLYLPGSVRKASDSKVGDVVSVEIYFDKAYKNGPQHPLPPWFKGALDKNKVAKQAWEVLMPSRKKEILRYFATLKSREAKERNLERVLHVLSGKKERFMARTWNEKQK